MNGMNGSFLHKCRYFCYKCLPIKVYLKIFYFVFFKKNLNTQNPKRFSEKIFCLKIINFKKYGSLLTECYDKYTVRGYIVKKLGKEQAELILNDLFFVFNTVDEIDFDKLPDKFVLKITQSSGCNIICPNKSKLDKILTIKKLKEWIEKINSLEQLKDAMEESYYFNGKAKIICEKFLESNKGAIPIDFRIYCFNGAPKLIVCDFGTTEKDGQHGQNIVRNVYDLEWNLLNVNLGRAHDKNIIMSKPKNLERMISIARKLSEDFMFVRVDLYDLDDKIVFGELTPIPMGGHCIITPEKYDLLLGAWLKIPPL